MQVLDEQRKQLGGFIENAMSGDLRKLADLADPKNKDVAKAFSDMMGKFGYPILIRHQMPIPELRALLDGYQEDRLAAGAEGPLGVTLQVPVYVAESSQRAREDTEAGVRRDRELLIETARKTGDQEAYERLRQRPADYEQLLQRPGLAAFPNPLLFGTPEDVGDRIQEYQEQLGVTGISMTVNPGNIPNERIVNSLRLFAERVMPRFR